MEKLNIMLEQIISKHKRNLDGLEKIENKIPVSIETSSEYVKLYNNGKKITITSDRYKSQTFLINIVCSR